MSLLCRMVADDKAGEGMNGEGMNGEAWNACGENGSDHSETNLTEKRWWGTYSVECYSYIPTFISPTLNMDKLAVLPMAAKNALTSLLIIIDIFIKLYIYIAANTSMIPEQYFAKESNSVFFSLHASVYDSSALTNSSSL